MNLFKNEKNESISNEFWLVFFILHEFIKNSKKIMKTFFIFLSILMVIIQGVPKNMGIQ